MLGTLLAATAMASSAQAGISYDFSHAQVATGPAGTLANTVVSQTSDGEQRGIALYFYQSITGMLCNPCSNFLGQYSIQSTQDGGLGFQFPDVPFGTVSYDATLHAVPTVLTGLAHIQAYGGVYTELAVPLIPASRSPSPDTAIPPTMAFNSTSRWKTPRLA
jgi:hypothetical protein